MLDGEPFLPGGTQNPLDCVYQLINGERFFTVDAAKRNANFNLLSLSTNARELSEGQTYQLLNNLEGNVYAHYSFSGESSFTDSNQTSNLVITKLDLEAQIVSITFFFDIIDQNGDLRTITDGRFDIQFTQ